MNSIASDIQTPTIRGLQNPLFIPVVIAVVFHASLLLVQFRASQRTDQEPTLDITLIQQPTINQQESQSPQVWQPDFTPLRQPEAAPTPITSQANESTPTVSPVAVIEPPKPEAAEEAPVLTGSMLRQAGIDAMRELPEATLAPETIRRKYVSANTQDWKYLSYMRAWTDKVERVGNLNYPEQARRKNLQGTLVVSVGVYPDGELESVEILRSSGFDLLDQAAIHIVEQSAPFAALPQEVTSEVDILHITRTWRFTPERGLIN